MHIAYMIQYLHRKMLPKRIGQADIRQRNSLAEQRGNFSGSIARDATADGCDQKCEFGVLLCKSDKPVHSSTHIIRPFHRGNSITPTLQALTLPHNCAKTPDSKCRSTAIVHTTHIAAKDKDFVGAQL